ncbi:MAG: hypothetical protein MUF42_16755 [Cytophagaceae bacterium]|jgi:hypothetical protein|nr:hypothetical protein [Cytophagaceae bacterium]
MALISIVLIVVGFLITVYAGVMLSLSKPMQTETGMVNQSKVFSFSVLISIACVMVIAGVLGYYALSGNLPYFIGNAQ